MELHLTTRELKGTGETLDVPIERAVALIRFIDIEMMKITASVLRTPFLVLVETVAKECNSLEEYTYALIYLVRKSVHIGFIEEIDPIAEQN